MEKKRDKKEMKVWQMLVGVVIGVIVFCLPLLLPRSVPNGGKIALFLVGLGILAVVLLTFASQRGGVRCPNCGARWSGGYRGMGIAKHTSEGIFRCPRCGTMIDMK